MRLPFILTACFGFAACGGSTVVISDDGGAVSDATADGGSTNDGGATGDGGSACVELANEIATVKTEAQKCCPTCDSLLCTQVAQDLCCVITVGDFQKGQELTALVQKYKSSCRYACPAMPCPKAPSVQCGPSALCL